MPHLHVHVITIIGPDITETAMDMSEGAQSIEIASQKIKLLRQGSVARKIIITWMNSIFHTYLWFCLFLTKM